MASEKMMEVGEGQETDTPQAITITIVDPSTLDNSSMDPALVARVEAQEGTEHGSIVMVAGDDHGSKDIIQTVTETHINAEEMPIISNISNPDEEEEEEEEEEDEEDEKEEKEEDDEETSVHERKMNMSESFDGGGNDTGDGYETALPHCLICNTELAISEPDEKVSVFKTQTSTSQRRVAVFLSGLVGERLTTRKAHSDILCRRCFSLLDRVDCLEIEIQEVKEEIINKYQETVSLYGGRTRRRKSAMAKQTDYVFPKVEPEDQLLDMDMDGNFEPQVEDLMDEDGGIHDDEWEPEFKRPRIKRESSDYADSSLVKKKRGRPRKGTTRTKRMVAGSSKSLYTRNLHVSSRIQADDGDQDGDEGVTHKFPRPSDTGNGTDSEGEVNDDSMMGEGKTSQSSQRIKRTVAATGKSPDGGIRSNVVHQCPFCFSILFKLGDLRNHFKTKHGDIKSVKCTKCNKQMPAHFNMFLAHCKSHESDGVVQPIIPNIQECYVCHKQVPSTTMSRHLATHQMLQCPTCHQNVSKRHFNRHVNWHTKERSYCCKECPAVFYDASHLSSHRRRNHMGMEVRRHVCELCGKKYMTPSELRNHVATVHHNVKKFVCEYCGASYKTSSSLVYHRRVHTGEKPHTCQVCNRSYMTPSSLADHVRNVHGIEYQGRYKNRVRTGRIRTKKGRGRTQHNTNTAQRTRDGSPDERERVSAVYSLVESGYGQVVNIHPTASIHYYRQADAEEQYTMAELMPPTNTVQQHQHPH